MNKKAFLLIDSLICLIVVSCVSALCIYTYQVLDEYDENYKLYYEDINEEYSNIYLSLEECEKCQVEEETEADLDEDF